MASDRESGTRAKPRLDLHRLLQGARYGATAALAALVAYLPMKILQVQYGFWSAIAAIAVVDTEMRSAETTARDQLLGTVIGGTAGLGALSLPGMPTLAYAGAVMASMAACWLLDVPSASRLSGITVTLILFLPPVGESSWAVMLSRVLTFAWGICVAAAIVWLVGRLSRSAPP